VSLAFEGREERAFVREERRHNNGLKLTIGGMARRVPPLAA